MKFSCLIIVLLLISCQQKEKEHPKSCTPVYIRDTIYLNKPTVVRDTIYVRSTKSFWQTSFNISHHPNKDSIAGKAVRYYLDQPECSGLASAFYFGRYKPTYDTITPKLLDLATTTNKALRPFYLWCLHNTILISDGALSEYIGVPARKFIEQYPLDFFALIDSNTTPEHYKKWLHGIRYSGFYDLGNKYENLSLFLVRFEQEIIQNCPDCTAIQKNRITQLMADLAK